MYHRTVTISFLLKKVFLEAQRSDVLWQRRLSGGRSVESALPLPGSSPRLSEPTDHWRGFPQHYPVPQALVEGLVQKAKHAVSRIHLGSERALVK